MNAALNHFPVINIAATGRNIKRLRQMNGLSVRDLQEYFGFEYPQAIYKWEASKCLPTLDNLFALSKLYGVPMEAILVGNDQDYFLSLRMRFPFLKQW